MYIFDNSSSFKPIHFSNWRKCWNINNIFWVIWVYFCNLNNIFKYKYLCLAWKRWISWANWIRARKFITNLKFYTNRFRYISGCLRMLWAIFWLCRSHSVNSTKYNIDSSARCHNREFSSDRAHERSERFGYKSYLQLAVEELRWECWICNWRERR